MPGFHVRYFDGPTEISGAVIAGGFVTPLLEPGEWYQFKARVRVTADAAPG